MYINLKEAVERAERLNYTVGAFNIHNLEMLPEMIRAAKEEGAPIIIQTGVSTAKYIGYRILSTICKLLAETELVDVILHLDHAKNFDDIKKAIDNGYSSVMFDGSALPFKENIMKTAAVVKYAHARGVSVEGELGIIGGTEDGHSIDSEKYMHTKPEDAAEFVRQTGVDALAVAIGTNHGQYKSKTNVRTDLLKKINEAVNVPLVIHGGTGVREEDIPELINNGIRKFNIGTELLTGWTKTAKEKFGKTSLNNSLRNNIIPCNETVKNIVKHKIGIFMNKNQPIRI